MKQKEKAVLLKIFSSLLLYNGYFSHCNKIHKLKTIELDGKDTINNKYPVETCYPYLRPMSSMTDEEKEYLQSLHNIISDENYGDGYSPAAWDAISEFNDYCHAHHLDNRGLIGKGLALETPEHMYD